MTTLLRLTLGLAAAALCLSAAEPAPNAPTPEEKSDGWRLLWDGRTSDGWRGARAEAFPAKGWEMNGGVLSVLATGGQGPGPGGDIVTRERFSDFELSLEFRITEGANSGVKYFVDGRSSIGLEYQILDDARHPDAKQGRDGNRTLASVFALDPGSDAKPTARIGEWNTARIVSRGAHVEHWLNGEKVVEYERFTGGFRRQVQASKYKNTTGFGEWRDGHILLQDHGDAVHFRNLKIRPLSDEASR